jgi:hypothetical protein
MRLDAFVVSCAKRLRQLRRADGLRDSELLKGRAWARSSGEKTRRKITSVSRQPSLLLTLPGPSLMRCLIGEAEASNLPLLAATSI